MNTRAMGAALAAAVLLAGCGGGSSSSPSANLSGNPSPGSLVTPTLTYTASAAILANILNAGGSTGQLELALATDRSGNPLPCGIDVYHYEYTSVDGQGHPVSASAALMLPTGAGATCSGARPLLEYAHGTSLDQSYDIAALNDPTNPAYAEGLLVAAMYAANGYIVIAPDYVGYATSSASYHPYLIKAAQSQDMIDALAAGKQALAQLGTTLSGNGQLFLTGYSQGGYVALATEQAMQKAGMTVTAASPGSGPYALASLVDYLFMGHPDLGAPQLGSLLIESYQDAYGNVYSSPSQVFGSGLYAQLPYPSASAAAHSPLTATLPIFDSVAPNTGDLSTQPPPADDSMLNAVFAITVPSGATINEPLGAPINGSIWFPFFSAAASWPISVGSTTIWPGSFARTGYLINQTYRADYLADALLNPDAQIAQGEIAGEGPSTQATNALRQDLARNDLRGYVPTPPTMLCGGYYDPVVYYPLDTTPMLADWGGATPGHFAFDLDAIRPATENLDVPAQLLPLQTLFAQTKAATPAATWLAEYHTLVGAFCAAAAQQYFASF